MKDWLEYIKDITPIKNKEFIAKPLKKTSVKKECYTYITEENAPNGVDKKTQKKFMQEKFDIEATLDLHGYNHDTAFNAVINFVKRAYANKKRCILIVTGKGEVLRTELPKWLENQEIKNMILKTTQPSNALGGSGAFMLLIKRQRT